MTEGQNEPLTPSSDEPTDERSCGLVERPQRLGVVPTWRFWSDPDNWALVRGPAAVLIGVITFAVAISGLPPALAAVVAPLVFLFAVGLLERYVRAQGQAQA